jgi:ribonuclease HI
MWDVTFKVLKKAFSWTEECERAFAELKTYLTNPPLLSRPVEGEILYLYLAVSRTAVSSVLVREESGKQRPIYFTSKVLHGAEERYPRIEKLAYALVISARRLRPYFQAHAVRVLTEYPLRKILQKSDLSGRLVNWAIELGQYDIEYHPRTAVKGQALADFVVEMSETPNAEELPKGSTWIAYVDGSSTGGRCGAGIAFRGPNREEFRYALKFGFAATNNEAEYEAVLSAMEIGWEMGIMNLEVRSDSRVVVEQVNGSYTAQEARMSRYLDKVRQFNLYFDKVVLTKVRKEENGLADALSRIGSGTDPAVTVGGCKILVKARPAISSDAEVMQLNESEPEWGAEIVRYLKMGELPPGKREAQKVIRNSARYVLVGGILYRRGYSLPLLKCLPGEDASYVLKEVHHGVCGNHSGAKALANKIIRAGYY